MTVPSNPFVDRTLSVARPALPFAAHDADHAATVRAEQRLWDDAERTRVDRIEVEEARMAVLLADESPEEPATKALENRLRVAFLGKPGATMHKWLDQRVAILGAAGLVAK